MNDEYTLDSLRRFLTEKKGLIMKSLRPLRGEVEFLWLDTGLDLMKLLIKFPKSDVGLIRKLDPVLRKKGSVPWVSGIASYNNR